MSIYEPTALDRILPAAELADWIEAQGEDLWWSVDGDRRIASRVALPCPAGKFAAEVRTINRPFCLFAPPHPYPPQPGGFIYRTDLEGLATYLADFPVPEQHFPTLELAWEGSHARWYLFPDLGMTALYRRLAAEQVEGM